MTAAPASPAAASGPSAELSPQVSRVKSASSTVSASNFAYPHGHLGYLSPQQDEALQKFKAILEERGAWTRGPPPSHNEQTLLYALPATSPFLLARVTN